MTSNRLLNFSNSISDKDSNLDWTQRDPDKLYGYLSLKQLCKGQKCRSVIGRQHEYK